MGHYRYPPISIWEDMGAKSGKTQKTVLFSLEMIHFAMSEWQFMSECVFSAFPWWWYILGESQAGLRFDVKSYDGKHGQKEIVFSLRPRMFSRACVARAHSLAIWRFCFHNLHSNLYFCRKIKEGEVFLGRGIQWRAMRWNPHTLRELLKYIQKPRITPW